MTSWAEREADRALGIEPDEQPAAATNNKPRPSSNRCASQATLLTELAGDVELFHSPAGDAYATFPVADHFETARLTNRLFRRWLSRQFFVNHKKTPASQSLQDAITALEGRALFEGAEHPVHVRVAALNDTVFVDLCNPVWQVVEICEKGWRVVNDCPVKFRRPKAMLSLPTPVTGGRFSDARDLLNVDDDGMLLIASWLAAALRPDYSFPLLCLHGEQGSAKTTTARAIRSLVDPNVAPLRCEPRDGRDLAIAANNGWIVALDNLSYIRPWLSDAMCRLSTGGGFSTRTLYENDEETIFDALRPQMITGIEEVATRGDLVDRSIFVSLPTIPENKRMSESQFWCRWDAMRPKLFGAVLSAVAAAIRRLPTIRCDRLPRMADFAMWAVAAEPAFQLQGDFLSAYCGNRQSANDMALEASPVAKYLLAMMDNRDEWTGTATELLDAVSEIASESDKRRKGWPSTPRSISGHVKRLSPNLRARGIHTRTWRSDRRYLRLTRLDVDSIVDTVGTVDDSEKQGRIFNDSDGAAGGHDAFASTEKPLKQTAFDANDGYDTKSRSDSCEHEWSDKPTGDGRVKTSCAICGKFRGYRTETGASTSL